tara:strand:+ start:4698 stop:4934 length:237 start_codon:yes stop_codon:yes gene_type:complete
MCLICIEIEKDKLTTKEARNNLSELRDDMSKEHRLEVLKLIWKKEDEEQQKYFDETMIDQNIDEYKGMIDLWRSFGGD